jgi:hypothetical protein
MSKLNVSQLSEDSFEIDTANLKSSILDELKRYGPDSADVFEQIRKTGKCTVNQNRAVELTYLMEGRRPGWHTFGGERLFYALLEVKYWYR